ncbi:hypothetical protein GHT06_003102 [Daphnia sinensis]|uniref:Uncharacterized protein n=1 Tax=Daphnia sinensis TaxID=1820382 RepID=A0AAD5PL35_9CRUS|nr:hypothetical protein GHT06_003102 [Daphnia sinensis]
MSSRGYFWIWPFRTIKRYIFFFCQTCPCPKVSPTRHPKDIIFWSGMSLFQIIPIRRHPYFVGHVLVSKYPWQDILRTSFFCPGLVRDFGLPDILGMS